MHFSALESGHYHITIHVYGRHQSVENFGLASKVVPHPDSFASMCAKPVSLYSWLPAIVVIIVTPVVFLGGTTILTFCCAR